MAAGPGAGKTALIHAMLHKGKGKNRNSVMFFSADTPSDIMWKRSAALATGYEQSEIERMDEASAVQAIEAKIQKTESHIVWCFDTQVPIARIYDQLEAFLELHDAFPEVIVVDVLKKMVPVEDPDEWRAIKDATDDLVGLAKHTGAAVIALHHVSGHLEDGTSPIPLSGLMGKVGKDPSLVLTIYKRGSDELRVSVVKNRGGKADAGGGLSFGVEAKMGSMQFRG